MLLFRSLATSGVWTLVQPAILPIGASARRHGAERYSRAMLQIEPFAESYTDDVVALCAAEGWPSWTPERVSAAFSAPGVIALVAHEDGDLIGIAELLTDGEVIAYLGLLVVARRARRRGVGRRLIGELFARCGLSRIDLLAEMDSTDFYESLPHKLKPGYRIYRAI